MDHKKRARREPDISAELREYLEWVMRNAAEELIMEELAAAKLQDLILDVSAEWKARASVSAYRVDAGPQRRTGKASK